MVLEAFWCLVATKGQWASGLAKLAWRRILAFASPPFFRLIPNSPLFALSLSHKLSFAILQSIGIRQSATINMPTKAPTRLMRL
jgi:hypothetical protein